jgi:NIPSNAP
MKKSFMLSLAIIATSVLVAQKKESIPEIYDLRVYHYSSMEQEKRILTFMETALIPALHKQGIKDVGAFESLANDTVAGKRIYLLIPWNSHVQKFDVEKKIAADPTFISEGADYVEATYDKPVYDRIEFLQLRAFHLAPRLQRPALTGDRSQRVYELRSYESASEKIYRNKVEMFNEGGEITLFKRLNFNAIFYGDVISGSRMPNLMYMTSFENMADRDAHWKTFVEDAEWKSLSTKPEYQHNISKMDIYFLRPLEFSDY